MTQKLRMFSPLALLGLAACGGGTTTGVGGSGGGGQGGSSSGVAVKGLLQNALAFVDSDGSKTLNGNEVFARTDENGAFTLDNPNSDPVVILTDRLTTDKSSGAVTPGLRLMGAADATVISPYSGLALDGVDTTELAKALNLEGIDLLTFNPYADGVDAAQALAVEKASQQLVGTLKVLAGAMVGAGASSEADAFGDAFEALVEVTRQQLSEDTPTIDFQSDELLSALVDQADSGGKIGDTDVTELVGQIKQLNELISEVDALDSDEASNTFSSSEVLANAYESGLTEGNDVDVESVADNSLPAEITITAEDGAPLSVTETVFRSVPVDLQQDLVVGQIGVSDDGAAVGTVEILGEHAALFEIVEGVLMLRSNTLVDFEAVQKLNITLLATDQGGKSIARDFEIAVANVDEPAVNGGIDITGSFRALEPLSVDLSNVSDPDNGAGDFAEVRYQWLVNGEAVDGATDATFTPKAGDVEGVVSVRVTLVDQSGGETEFVEQADTPVAAPSLEAIEDAPVEAHIYGDVSGVKDDLKQETEELGDLTNEWAGNVMNFMTDFQKTLDAIAGNTSSVDQPQEEAAFARAAIEVETVEEEADGPNIEYSFGTTGDYVELTIEVDWDRDGNRDNWIEVEFESINASTLDEFETLLKGISLKDPASLAVAGKIHQIELNSVTEELELTHRDSSSSDYDSYLSVRYQVRDENGERINDPSKLETLRLLGSFDNGIEPLLRLAADAQEQIQRNEPSLADYFNTETGQYDFVAYQAAQDAFNAETDQNGFELLSKVLGGDGADAIAGLEGISLYHYKDSEDNSEQAFKMDLFDTPDEDGTQSATIKLGDYTLQITGDLPETPGALLPLLDPETGSKHTADHIDSLYDDGATPDADTVFDIVMNGFSEGDKTYAGLKDGGLGGIESIKLYSSDTSLGVNGKILDVEVDFDAIAKLLIENKDADTQEPMVFTDASTGHSVAQHPDGYYVVLGEGIALDDFKELLDLDDTGAAVG